MALNRPPRPRPDLVSAGSFGPIQRGVRLPKKSSKIGCTRCFRSHANADGELRGPVFLNKCTRLTSLAKTLRNRDSRLEVNAWQKDRELVSALAANYFETASNRLFKHLGKVFESAVSSLVPVSLIEATKGIDIAQERGDRLSQAPCFLKGLGCDSVESCPIQQSSQPVDHR